MKQLIFYLAVLSVGCAAANPNNGQTASAESLAAAPQAAGDTKTRRHAELAGTHHATQAELVRLETVWNSAHLRGDSKALDKLWSDDFDAIVPKMPVFKKSLLVAFVREGRMKFSQYETSDLQFRYYGSCALVTGRLQRARTLEGRSLSDDWQFTKVYVRQKGKWRVVSFQASDRPTE
jgi:hypothetical protein